MPIDFEADLDEIVEKEGGKGLRQWAEAVQAEARETMSELATLKADKVIQEHGYTLVKPEDLAGTSVDELGAKAEAVQAERLEAQKVLARDMLARKGLGGEELEAAVDEFLSQPDPTDAEARERAAAAARAGGVPTPLVNTDELHGVEAIRHGLSKTV